jgi:hypothetical protein
MKSFALILAIALAGAAGQASDAGQFTATLKTPLTEPKTVVRGQTAWRCGQAECRATVVADDTRNWRACRDLVRAVGAVSAYGALDAAALAKCNEAAK